MTAAVDVPTGTLLVTVTLQYTLLPPPVTMPLHWFTEVTSWVEDVVLVIGPKFRGQDGNVTPAAAKHTLVVTVELVAPLELLVLTTATVQVTWNPAVMGKSGGLHCATAGAPLVAAEATVAEPRPISASEANAAPAATATTRERRTLPARDALDESVVCVPLELEV